MAVRAKGDTSLRMVDRRIVMHPQFGDQVEEIYEGWQSACEGHGAFLRSQGATCETRRKQGPWFQLIANWGAPIDGSEELPVEIWERETEFHQRDILSNPNVIAAAGNSHVLKTWVKQIKEALRTDQKLHTIAGFASEDDLIPEFKMLYDLFVRGTTGDEFKLFTISSRRAYSTLYLQRAQCSAIETVYTTPQLIAQFLVPPEFARTLPEDPPESATPSGTRWGWRIRTDDQITYPAIGKVEEMRDWMFAAWSTLLYNFFSQEE